MKGKTINKIHCLKHIKENFGKISQREMARRLGIGKTTVNRWSKELGLEVKKNTVNEDFFKKWTRDMSYICQRSLSLAEWIYKDANIFLDRKFQQYELAIKSKGSG